MSDLYTVGIWIVKPGKEDEFVKAWSALAEWTKSTFEGAGSATLLRDQGQPNRFVSFGPWRSEADIAQWRSSDRFRDGVSAVRPLLEEFQPGTFTAVYKL
jgi:heme-degrading monooxygenase HmoA